MLCAYWSESSGLKPCNGSRDEHDFGLGSYLSRDFSHHRFLAPGESREPRFGCNRYDWYALSLRPVQAEFVL